MSWKENDQFTEVAEPDEQPIMGVTGGQRAREGDTMTLTFESDGEEIETENGPAVAFDVVLESASFDPVDADGDKVAEGQLVRLMTSSSRFLAEMVEIEEIDGATLEIEVEGVGYDAAYSINPVE